MTLEELREKLVKVKEDEKQVQANLIAVQGACQMLNILINDEEAALKKALEAAIADGKTKEYPAHGKVVAKEEEPCGNPPQSTSFAG